MADLTGVLIKWTRGNEHLHAISESLDAYSRSAPCIVVPRIDIHTQDKVWEVVGDPTSPPESPNPIIGEAFYNYRSCLDHLAWQLVIEAGGTPSEQTAFLICDDEQKYSSGYPRRLKGMSDSMKSAIRNLQPYLGRHVYRDRALWGLERLSNIDKHRHFNVTLSATDGGFWSPGLPLDAVERVEIHQGAIEAGTILARVPEEYAYVDFAAAYGVAFDFLPSGREILFGINEAVAGIVEEFARAFFATQLDLKRF